MAPRNSRRMRYVQLRNGAREMKECDMEKFGILESSEISIAILGIDGGHRRRNMYGIRLGKGSYGICGNNVTSAELLEVSLLEVGTVLRLGSDA